MMMPELQVCDHPALLSKRAASVIAQKGATNTLGHCSRSVAAHHLAWHWRKCHVYMNISKADSYAFCR